MIGCQMKTTRESSPSQFLAVHRCSPPHSHTAFSHLYPSVHYHAFLQSLLDHTSAVITSASQRFPCSIVLRSAGLAFFEACVPLPTECELPVAVLPSPAFAYSCLVADEVMSVSRICGIVGR